MNPCGIKSSQAPNEFRMYYVISWAFGYYISSGLDTLEYRKIYELYHHTFQNLI